MPSPLDLQNPAFAVGSSLCHGRGPGMDRLARAQWGSEGRFVTSGVALSINTKATPFSWLSSCWANRNSVPTL